MSRFLILFAREPAREAREKGFAAEEAADLFTTFAAGWCEAARLVRARLVLATPPEDRAAWCQRLGGSGDLLFISQRGRSFGERLEETARQIAALGGKTILVGGDVAPSTESLADAFALLESGADAVLGPAEDGGVSLIGLRPEDLDLLGAIAPRRQDVFDSLRHSLSERGRRVGIVRLTLDVDGRAELRAFLRGLPISTALRSLARRALRPVVLGISPRPAVPRVKILANPSGLRAPPLHA